MTSKLGLLCAVASIGAVAITGCGSSSSGSSSSSASSSAAPAATSATASASAPASSSAAAGGSGAAAASPAVQQAVAACKSSINAAPTLTADEKTKLSAICDKAANGDEAGVKQAAYQVCQEIVKSSVPSGAAQTSALAACPKP